MINRKINKTINKIIIFFMLFISFAYGATVEDVQVLEMKESADFTNVKLRSNALEKNSYFYIHLNKNDPTFQDKLEVINNKKNAPNKYLLNLNIISFSPYPSGSVYSSNDVLFQLEKK